MNVTASAQANANTPDDGFDLVALRDSLDWTENHQPAIPWDVATTRRRRLLAASAFVACMAWTLALTVH